MRQIESNGVFFKFVYWFAPMMGVEGWYGIKASLQKTGTCLLNYVNPRFCCKIQFKVVRKIVWYQLYAKWEAISASDFAL